MTQEEGVKNLEAIRFNAETDQLLVLDQLQLPAQHTYIQVDGVEQAWAVIRNMNVRGAPAIAIVAVLGLVVELKANWDSFRALSVNDVCHRIGAKLDFLATSRPTAVNLKRSCDDIRALLVKSTWKSSQDLLQSVTKYALELFQKDVNINKAIGRWGAQTILAKSGQHQVSILTHCNTGSLATAGYGTALGVIRSLHETQALTRAYCTETRPYNQGSRLTAYELVYEKIPATLICDNMVGALMKTKRISAVVVGADRVVANGDTANKIGTYQLAILAQYHEIPFYVVSPLSTIDLSLANGSQIPIEERKGVEMRVCGCPAKKEVPPAEISVWNPAFDVTPAELITGGIITEIGTLQPPLDSGINLEKLRIMSGS